MTEINFLPKLDKELDKLLKYPVASYRDIIQTFYREPKSNFYNKGSIYFPHKEDNDKHEEFHEYPLSFELLSKPTAILYLDVRDIAAEVDKLCSPYIKYPKGLYSRTSVDAVIEPNGLYYINDFNNLIMGQDMDYDFIFKHKLPVYNKRHKQIITHNKGDIYSEKPLLPYVGLYMLAWFFADYIDHNLSKLPSKHRIGEHKFKDKLLIDEDVNIDAIFSVIYQSLGPTILKKENSNDDDVYMPNKNMINLRKFVNNDKYHLYDIFVRADTIEVTKYVDFRIYEWSLYKENEVSDE